MPWVRFTKDFDYSPAAKKGWVTLAYKAGAVHNVTRNCAELALAAGKAEEINRNEDSKPGTVQREAEAVAEGSQGRDAQSDRRKCRGNRQPAKEARPD